MACAVKLCCRAAVHLVCDCDITLPDACALDLSASKIWYNDLLSLHE
jgi:hypothetical protein